MDTSIHLNVWNARSVSPTTSYKLNVHSRSHLRTLPEVRDVSRPVFPPFSLHFSSPLLSSDLLWSPLLWIQSCNKSISVNVQRNKSKSFDECYLPGSCPPHHCSMTHQPPWKHSATSKCIVWHFIWHVLVRHIFFVGSSGDDCAESNMQTGEDDEDLQKALALSLEPVEDWRNGARKVSINFHHGFMGLVRSSFLGFTAICKKNTLTWWILAVLAVKITSLDAPLFSHPLATGATN